MEVGMEETIVLMRKKPMGGAVRIGGARTPIQQHNSL